ncbi:hypothetical protein AVEN_203517-1 [Araneus ventricosus]|uniref:Uncharacterized protein n=1 Tax=Araneus ventricosus TaxID=182803 RepID=A0A4Y2PVP2_ARAVE|nr:hypothetical protein AVEN_203517-1 [Araneus ventricosus]
MSPARICLSLLLPRKSCVRPLATFSAPLTVAWHAALDTKLRGKTRWHSDEEAFCALLIGRKKENPESTPGIKERGPQSPSTISSWQFH